jgi:hypothetical protein
MEHRAYFGIFPGVSQSKSKEQEARSRKQGAGSKEQEARSRKQGAGSKEQEARSRKQGAGRGFSLPASSPEATLVKAELA